MEPKVKNVKFYSVEKHIKVGKETLTLTDPYKNIERTKESLKLYTETLKEKLSSDDEFKLFFEESKLIKTEEKIDYVRNKNIFNQSIGVFSDEELKALKRIYSFCSSLIFIPILNINDVMKKIREYFNDTIKGFTTEEDKIKHLQEEKENFPKFLDAITLIFKTTQFKNQLAENFDISNVITLEDLNNTKLDIIHIFLQINNITVKSYRFIPKFQSKFVKLLYKGIEYAKFKESSEELQKFIEQKNFHPYETNRILTVKNWDNFFNKTMEKFIVEERNFYFDFHKSILKDFSGTIFDLKNDNLNTIFTELLNNLSNNKYFKDNAEYLDLLLIKDKIMSNNSIKNYLTIQNMIKKILFDYFYLTEINNSTLKNIIIALEVFEKEKINIEKLLLNLEKLYYLNENKYFGFHDYNKIDLKCFKSLLSDLMISFNENNIPNQIIAFIFFFIKSFVKNLIDIQSIPVDLEVDSIYVFFIVFMKHLNVFYQIELPSEYCKTLLNLFFIQEKDFIITNEKYNKIYESLLNFDQTKDQEIITNKIISEIGNKLDNSTQDLFKNFHELTKSIVQKWFNEKFSPEFIFNKNQKFTYNYLIFENETNFNNLQEKVVGDNVIIFKLITGIFHLFSNSFLIEFISNIPLKSPQEIIPKIDNLKDIFQLLFNEFISIYIDSPSAYMSSYFDLKYKKLLTSFSVKDETMLLPDFEKYCKQLYMMSSWIDGLIDTQNIIDQEIKILKNKQIEQRLYNNTKK